MLQSYCENVAIKLYLNEISLIVCQTKEKKCYFPRMAFFRLSFSLALFQPFACDVPIEVDLVCEVPIEGYWIN